MTSVSLSSLRTKSFFRSAVVVASGAGLGQLIVVLSSPVLTRFYTPSDLGTLAVFAAILGVVSPVASLRIDAAIPVSPSAHEARALTVVGVVSIALVLLALATISASGLTMLLPTHIQGTLKLYGPFLAWAIPLTGAYNLASAHLTRNQGYSELARVRIIQGCLQSLVPLASVPFGLGATGLILGDIAGRAGAFSTALRGVMANGWGKAITRLPYASSLRTAAPFIAFSTPATLINYLTLQIPTLLIASLYGASEAGLLVLAQRISGVPLRLIGQATGTVFLAHLAARRRANESGTTEFFNRVTLRLALIATPLALLLGAIGPMAFATIFGPEWGEAGSLVLILAPAAVAQMVVSPISQTANALGRQGVQLTFDILRLVMLTFAVWLPSSLGLSFQSALVTISAAQTISYAGAFILYRHVISASEPKTNE